MSVGGGGGGEEGAKFEIILENLMVKKKIVCLSLISLEGKTLDTRS